jgi:RHS repeat-associated protein
LVSASAGNTSISLAYDGLGRLGAISVLENGLEVSNREYIWSDNEICEEREPDGTVSKRFFSQGVKLETGGKAGDYYYAKDHLKSIRELTDSAGNVRARYAYDPSGQRTKFMGDLDTDFGFAGMFWIGEARLNLTRFRAYDPNPGRWLSRDPLKDAEVEEGYNLFSYVRNNPVNLIDPLGLVVNQDCCQKEFASMREKSLTGEEKRRSAILACLAGLIGGVAALRLIRVIYLRGVAGEISVLAAEGLALPLASATLLALMACIDKAQSEKMAEELYSMAADLYFECKKKPCLPPPCAIAPAP